MGPLSPAGVLISTSPDRFPRMAAFYRDILALPVRSDRAGFINFAFGDQRLTVAVHSDVDDVSLDPKRILINFAIDDIDAAVAHLRANGVQIIRHAERERWGGVVATFQDPDGNLLQFMQFPTQSP